MNRRQLLLAILLSPLASVPGKTTTITNSPWLTHRLSVRSKIMAIGSIVWDDGTKHPIPGVNS